MTKAQGIFFSSTLLKFALLFIFSSAYFDDLFFPFVSSFLSEPFSNPWDAYYKVGADVFPYHALMLFVLSPFVFLANICGSIALAKIPLLLADMAIFLFLIKILRNKRYIYIYIYILSIQSNHLICDLCPLAT